MISLPKRKGIETKERGGLGGKIFLPDGIRADVLLVAVDIAVDHIVPLRAAQLRTGDAAVPPLMQRELYCAMTPGGFLFLQKATKKS